MINNSQYDLDALKIDTDWLIGQGVDESIAEDFIKAIISLSGGDFKDE